MGSVVGTPGASLLAQVSLGGRDLAAAYALVLDMPADRLARVAGALDERDLCDTGNPVGVVESGSNPQEPFGLGPGVGYGRVELGHRLLLVHDAMVPRACGHIQCGHKPTTYGHLYNANSMWHSQAGTSDTERPEGRRTKDLPIHPCAADMTRTARVGYTGNAELRELLMAWARIDDAFDDHPKVLALLESDQGGAAIGLWTLCLTWAHRNTLRRGKTPGLIPASLPRRYLGPGARELASLLVKEGLWEPLAEADGWMIHDFDKYLPTEKTREARAEAGRKGAAKRWERRRKDGKEPGTDGNLLDGQSKESPGGHGVASDPMANDGSRAPARRAISKEIAPVPVPVPPTAGGTFAPPSAQTILAEFINWDRSNGGTLTKRTTGQLAKHIGDLVEQGIDDRYIRRGLADWRASGQNPVTLDSFVNAAMRGASARASPRLSTGDQAVIQGAALKAQIHHPQEPA